MRNFKARRVTGSKSGLKMYCEAVQLVVAGVGVGAVEEGGVGAEDGIKDFDLGVGVDAFVEPGVLELVGGDHAVPVLVAELVFGGDLGDVGGVVPGGVGSEEGGVLHATHLGAGLGVDDGDDLVGVGAVALVELRPGSSA